MFDYLAYERLDTNRARQLTALLHAGPWCWPAPGVRYDRARAYVQDGPPSPSPGDVLLVTAHSGAGTLWAFRPSAPDARPAGADVREFDREAKAAWRAAEQALRGALTVVWDSVERMRRATLVAERLLSNDGEVAFRQLNLDGRSFGISFLLSRASLMLQVAVPARFAASGAVDAAGAVRRVDDLGAKLDAVVAHAPCVSHFLVAAEQYDEAVRVAQGSALQIVPVGDAGEIVRAVFGDLEALLTELCGDAPRFARTLSSLEAAVLCGRDELWPAIRRAAEVAARAAAAVATSDQARSLALLAGIAARHASNAGELPPLDATWAVYLATTPEGRRLRIVAQYTQHAADTGDPPADLVESFAARLLKRGADAVADHHGLLGAVARLYAVTGRAREALAMQEEATRGMIQLLEFASATRPLSEWFRLAGSLGDVDALHRAEEAWRSLQRRAFDDKGGGRYVTLSRAKARFQTGLASISESERALATIVDDNGYAVQLRWSAARWLVRAYDLLDAPADAARLVARLEAEANRGSVTSAPIAARYLQFVALDRAVRAGDSAGIAAALDQVTVLQPGLLAHLRRAAAGEELGAYVSRMFPY